MMSGPPLSLRIFSLNCWGVRYISKHCSKRFNMIAEMLYREQHDIVLLQEVWSEKDYLLLKRKLNSTHHHSYHFKSGLIGSGLVVFTKHKINDAFVYRYSVNGFPYNAQHGDWFCGKSVGLVILNIRGLNIHVYVTHLHAEYNRRHDVYLPHRVVQAWELQNFVRHTSHTADVVILGGDLNMHPEDVGNRLLRYYTGLEDCFTAAQKFDGYEEGFTLIADNPFIKKKDLIPFEKGIRIDYILFKGSKKVNITCKSLSTTKGSLPGMPFPYSDHESLTAELVLQNVAQRGGADDSNRDVALADAIKEARSEVKKGLHYAERGIHRAIEALIASLILLLLRLLLAVIPTEMLPANLLSCPVFSPFVYLLGIASLLLVMAALPLCIFHIMQRKALHGADDQMMLAVTGLQHGSDGNVTSYGEQP